MRMLSKGKSMFNRLKSKEKQTKNAISSNIQSSVVGNLSIDKTCQSTPNDQEVQEVMEDMEEFAARIKPLFMNDTRVIDGDVNLQFKPIKLDLVDFSDATDVSSHKTPI